MPIISSHLLPMELYLHRLLDPLPPHLFCLILIACCASLFPCSSCLDVQYQYCQNTNKCGTMNISYPFGVGKRGCGLPGFQIDCVQNLTLVIAIQDQNYTILFFDNHSKIFYIVSGEKCKFLDDAIDKQIPPPERTDTTFRIAEENRTLNVYKCNKQGQLNHSRMFKGIQCNDSVYYSLYENRTFIPGCSKAHVTVDVGIMQPDYKDTKRDESCRSCEESHGICGYRCNTSYSTAPFVCYCKDGPRTDKCPAHGMLYFIFSQNFLELLVQFRCYECIH